MENKMAAAFKNYNRGPLLCYNKKTIIFFSNLNLIFKSIFKTVFVGELVLKYWSYTQITYILRAKLYTSVAKMWTFFRSTGTDKSVKKRKPEVE